MNRIIKFRAWDGFKMYEPCVWMGKEYRPFYDDFIETELMQFTGLKDKNGKEMYEFHEINNKYRVVFKFNRYILQHISNRDINLEFESDGIYEITGEYSPLQEN